MKVKLEMPEQKELEFDRRMKVHKMLEELHINPESVIVIRGGELLTADDWAEVGDEIRIRGVISGG